MLTNALSNVAVADVRCGAADILESEIAMARTFTELERFSIDGWSVMEPMLRVVRLPYPDPALPAFLTTTSNSLLQRTLQ